MIVHIGGMPRSGSTFTFNIARETLARRGAVAAIPVESLVAALEHVTDERQLVIKSHGTDRALKQLIRTGGALCVCSFRKPEDAVASWVRTFGFTFDDALGLVEAWIAWHRDVADIAMNIDYRDIEQRPLRVIFRIQRHLTGRIDLAEAYRLRRRYDREAIAARVTDLPKSEAAADAGFTHYDKVTFFHRRHISPPGQRTAESTLSADQIASVRTRLAAHIDSAGGYMWR